MHEANTQCRVYERDWNRSGRSNLPEKSPFQHLLGLLGQKIHLGINPLRPGSSLAEASECTESQTTSQQFAPIRKATSSHSIASEILKCLLPVRIDHKPIPQCRQIAVEPALIIGSRLRIAYAALLLLVPAMQQCNVFTLYRAYRVGATSLASELVQWLCTFAAHFRPYRDSDHTRHDSTSKRFIGTAGSGPASLQCGETCPSNYIHELRL